MPERYRDLIKLNYRLDQSSSLTVLNEKLLVSLYESLQQIDADSDLYDMSLVRVFELSIYYAGYCADMGDIQTAGDLVANPGKVEIYIDGNDDPIIKKRHESLSRLVQSRVSDIGDGEIAAFLRDKILTHVIKDPLLTEMMCQIKKSGRFTQGYMDVSENRIKCIAQTMGFIFSCHIPKGNSVTSYMSQCDPSDQKDIESNLCRFNLNYFHYMKQEIDRHLSRMVQESMICNLLGACKSN